MRWKWTWREEDGGRKMEEWRSLTSDDDLTQLPHIPFITCMSPHQLHPDDLFSSPPRPVPTYEWPFLV
jgi:hypothetical protein